MGKEGKYDLRLAEPPPVSDSDSDSDTEEDGDSAEVLSEPIQPSKLLKSSCVHLLRFLAISFGIHADQVPSNVGLGFTSFLRDIVVKGCCVGAASSSLSAANRGGLGAQAENTLLYQDQYEEWASLGMLKKINLN